MKFTESQLEAAIIELLTQAGYPHVLGETIDRQPEEVLIKDDLRDFLTRQYAANDITPGEIESVIRQLVAYSSADLYESNKAIMKLIPDGFLLKRESFADIGIDFEEKAFYDILKALTIKYDFGYPEDQLITLAQKVKVIVDDKAKYTDWSQRDDIKAELKVDLIILLAEHGYPPVDRDEVYKEIFEQAENFKRNK
nr:type I restriction enzyme endonuclease domain-containing protein [uncultured Desulfobacter sp.]